MNSDSRVLLPEMVPGPAKSSRLKKTTLTLIGAAAVVVARPIAGHPLRRFVYSCRLDTSRVPSTVADLEQCLDQAVAAVVLRSAEWSDYRRTRTAGAGTGC